MRSIMASEILNKITATTNGRKPSMPSIEITLTTFNDDENGDISEATSGTVKIDCEEQLSVKGMLIDSLSHFKSPIIRNLLVLSFGQFLLFMAFDSLANLQSTINGRDGVISLAVVYALLTVSSFFLPTVIIKTIGCKRTLVFAMICFCPYILGNFYPSWATLIPTAVVCGLAAGPLWTAKSTYLNQISHRYAKLQRTSLEVMNAWFFSVCTTFHQNTEIWGNLLSHYVLKAEYDYEMYISRNALQTCGPDFCDEEPFGSNPNLHLPSVARRYVLMTIFTAIVLMAAFFTAFFLDPLESEEEGEMQKQTFSPVDILATFHQLAKPDQVLLLPLSLYTGVVNGFYHGDYTKAFVACAWGIPHVGTVSICYGVVSALVDSAGGPCVLVLGRVGLFLLAAVAHLAMFISLTLWIPDPEHTMGFYLIAGAHGIGNGVWMSQLVALYGVLFRDTEEAAFSCFYFFNSLGFLVSYTYSSHLCTNVKLYIPLAMLVVGLVCYLAVEIRVTRKSFAEYDLKRQH